MPTVKVTCHTDECVNADQTIDTGIDSPGPDVWYCGGCSQIIEDVSA